MTDGRLRHLRIGFVPLLDCAILAVAKEKGFAAAHGLELELVPQLSWAALRDKLAYGLLDAAHVLAGIPLAATLGLGGVRAAMLAPMALGLGGNAITVARGLYEAMCEADPEAMAGPRRLSSRALAKVVAARRRAGRPRLAFASVFPFSSHNYELRYWLAAAGIDPESDVDIGVVAPARMVENLSAGYIDGYCVGEPWNLIAVEKGLGAVVVTKADIWPAAPEKVLAVRADWAESSPEVLAALIRALAEAARWADAEGNRPQVASILADRRYLGVSEELLRRGLCGEAVLVPGRPAEPLPHRPLFHRHAANFPWRSQALWLLAQMRRWRQVGPEPDLRAVAARVYRPDLFRAALADSGLPVPAADSKTEGMQAAPYWIADTTNGRLRMAGDRFMDGRAFDPADLEGYLAADEA